MDITKIFGQVACKVGLHKTLPEIKSPYRSLAAYKKRSRFLDGEAISGFVCIGDVPQDSPDVKRDYVWLVHQTCKRCEASRNISVAITHPFDGSRPRRQIITDLSEFHKKFVPAADLV